MGPGDLQTLLSLVSSPTGAAPRDPAILVGTETGDDAGVYQIAPDQAVVMTADFITPLLDDPGLFGEIAAANSLSDVYAMGGRPVVAINLCVFPDALAKEAAAEILAGAERKVAEAGAAMLGGHTVRGPELLFGLGVTGLVPPGRVWRNVGARPGDALLLTKPLGTGLLITGLRRGLVAIADIGEAIAGMANLNRRAAEVLRGYEVHAATDVTGFSLVGHALGMTRRGGVSLLIEAARLPVYPGAWRLAAAGVTCGGAKANRRTYADRLAVAPARCRPDDPDAVALAELLHDPQTSGGLLVALPEAEAEAALRALGDAGVAAARIGRVCAAEAGRAALRVE